MIPQKGNNDYEWKVIILNYSCSRFNECICLLLGGEKFQYDADELADWPFDAQLYLLRGSQRLCHVPENHSKILSRWHGLRRCRINPRPLRFHSCVAISSQNPPRGMHRYTMIKTKLDDPGDKSVDPK